MNENRLAPPRLLQYWQSILRWKYVIAGVILGCVAIGLVATMLMTRKYSAVTRIEISREQKKVTNVQGLESEEVGRDLEFYQTQYALLRARSLAERVAQTLGLQNNAAFFKAHGEELDDSTLFGTTRAGALTPRLRKERLERAVKLLLRNVSIEPVRGSSLVDVRYVSASPEISAQVANAWVQQFIGTSVDRRFSSTADARKFLESRLAGLRERLETSERDLVNYASRRGIVTLSATEDPSGRTRTDRTLLSEDLDALNQALASAISQRVSAESRLRATGTAGTSQDALTNTTIAEIRKQRAIAAAERAKLLVQFEPGYPAVRALDEQIANLDRSIAREEGRVSSSIAAQYQEALGRENDLRARVNALKGQFSGQRQDSIQYNIYQREVDTNRELYNALLQRYKEIGVAGVAADNIAIVDPASVPDRPSAPNFIINLALSLLVGIALAATITFALEQIDEGIREPGEVGRVLHLPLLGSVPKQDEGLILEQLADTKSVISEAYLSIQSSLAFSTEHGVPRSLMFTSTRPAEGKSTSALALAMLLGRTGKSVLLIDADMRSPSLHERLGLPNTRGLSNYLAGEDDVEMLVQPGGANMKVMTTGPMPPNAGELLSTNRMQQLVERLNANGYDHVVIDSPPILGLADAPLLSRVVEGTVFVIEFQGVAVRGIRAALDRLRSVHARVPGAILTKLTQQQAGYGYGYGYGYNYGVDDREGR